MCFWLITVKETSFLESSDPFSFCEWEKKRQTTLVTRLELNTNDVFIQTSTPQIVCNNYNYT